jgi:hypothetical protein
MRARKKKIAITANSWSIIRALRQISECLKKTVFSTSQLQNLRGLIYWRWYKSSHRSITGARPQLFNAHLSFTNAKNFPYVKNILCRSDNHSCSGFIGKLRASHRGMSLSPRVCGASISYCISGWAFCAFYFYRGDSIFENGSTLKHS